MAREESFFDDLARGLAEGSISRRGALKLIAGTAIASVIPSRALARQQKETICHKPGTPAEKTMEVPHSAVEGHLGHGDRLGPCETTTPTTTAAPTTSTTSTTETPTTSTTETPTTSTTETPTPTTTTTETPTTTTTETPTTTTTETPTTTTTTAPVLSETICFCSDGSQPSLGCPIDCTIGDKPIALCEAVCGVGNVSDVDCLLVPPGTCTPG
jgi:hypothetical protein